MRHVLEPYGKARRLGELAVADSLQFEEFGVAAAFSEQRFVATVLDELSLMQH